MPVDFLELPSRSAKPRQQGITHVIDRGLSIAEIDGLIEVAGESVDLVKLGWGTAVATGNLEGKLDRYRVHGVPVVLGGSLTELAIAQDQLDRLVAWVRELGLKHFEISDGTIALEHDRKLELIARLADEFTVLSEVGSKDDTGAITPPYLWVEQMRQELDAGAWKVIAEGRESGTAGIFRPSGEVREGLIDEIVHEIDPGSILFDAPRKDQQVWFVRRFGADVNLGNVPVDEVLALETLRLGLRSDTMGVERRES
ncbi:MAG TPA: phosphosulfolactate synthase [Solirubrobacteraceae bacterium]|nr:phosphosulfolactate synthase [Solirubrobacteraceae bacterium]